MNDKSIIKLIAEVKRWPQLYDRKHNDYSNPVVKFRAWQHIASAIKEDWETKGSEEKARIIREIQKKWGNLRTCLSRDLKKQEINKNCKKYVFYEHLSFLIPHTVRRRTVWETGDEAESYDKSCDRTGEEESDEDSNMLTDVTDAIDSSQFFSEAEADSKDRSKTVTLSEEKAKNIDEDLNFALSIVPLLRTLKGADKIEARIQILSVLKKIKYGTQRYDRPVTEFEMVDVLSSNDSNLDIIVAKEENAWEMEPVASSSNG